MNNFPLRLPSLTTVLWILASLVAFGAFLFIAPNLLNPPSPTAVPTGPVAVASARPTETVSTTATPLPPVPTARKSTPEPDATIPSGATVYTFVADPTRSGYLKGQDKPHWSDRNLHAGFFGGDTYSSILYFEIAQLPPNSEILSAQVELTGLSRDNLGAQGAWRAELIRVKPFEEWGDVTAQELQSAPSMTSIGSSAAPADLDLGKVNYFRFSADQLPALTNNLSESVYAIVRLVGPGGDANSLFTWDGGGLDLKTGAHPILRVVARPGAFVVVTNTPTAENVVTAAALALRETDFATRVGTPTKFPRTHATATPIILVTKEPTPQNVETRVAIARVATAVAVTTGTYTPTPENWIVVTATFTPLPTRTSEVVAISTLYARLTPTGIPTNTPTTRELLAKPLPDFLKGNLLVVTDRFKGKDIVVMRPDGAILQGLTGDEFYKLAQLREAYSPDRRRRVIYPTDSNGVQQIGIEDLQTRAVKLITRFNKGIAYDAAWAPDDSAIVFVATDIDNADQIYLYDFGAEQITPIVRTPGGQPWFKRPTWSADSQQIAYWSSVTGQQQIWVMNRDGSNPRNISNSDSNDYDPVWVK